MTTELHTSLGRPSVSRRDLAQILAGEPSGNVTVDGLLANVQCRARLVRALPRSLQTLLAFSGAKGLLLVPYHPDEKLAVDCVAAPSELAMATWLGTVEAPPLTVPQQLSPHIPVQDAVSPREVLQEAVLGDTDIRQSLAIEVRPRGEPGWQVLCVTGKTTQWGFGPLNTKVRVHNGGLIGLWALLRQVVVPPIDDSALVEPLGDATRCDSLVQSDQIQNQVGGPR